MKYLKLSLATLALAALAGCASNPTADIRAHSAPDAEFSRYATFSFPEQTGTDRGGYSTLVTSYFKAAVRDQMEQRGYHFVDKPGPARQLLRQGARTHGNAPGADVLDSLRLLRLSLRPVQCVATL